MFNQQILLQQPVFTDRLELPWLFKNKMNQAPGCVTVTNCIKNTIFITGIREEEHKYKDVRTES